MTLNVTIASPFAAPIHTDPQSVRPGPNVPRSSAEDPPGRKRTSGGADRDLGLSPGAALGRIIGVSAGVQRPGRGGSYAPLDVQAHTADHMRVERNARG